MGSVPRAPGIGVRFVFSFVWRGDVWRFVAWVCGVSFPWVEYLDSIWAIQMIREYYGQFRPKPDKIFQIDNRRCLFEVFVF